MRWQRYQAQDNFKEESTVLVEASLSSLKKSVVRVHHVGGNSATRYCDEVHHDGGRICLVKYLRKECPEDNQTTMVHLIREKFLCV